MCGRSIVFGRRRSSRAGRRQRAGKWQDTSRRPASPLRTELVPPDDRSLGELQSAFGLLENLQRFTLGGWQPNCALLPAAGDPQPREAQFAVDAAEVR